MYEEGRRNLSLNWGSLIVKLVILAVIVFIAGWVYVKVTGNSSSGNKSTLASTSNEYINNITNMKTAAFEYFTKSKLPEKVGGTEKVTLAQMINQKLLIDFTNDGKKCDTNASYIQATKTADGNYALKISLTCGDESDFIVTTIEKDENGNVDTKTNTDVVIDTSDEEKTNTSTNKSTTNNSSSSTNTNKSSSSSTNTSSNTSGSSSTKSSSSVTTKTTVTTKVTIKINCTSGCCQSNCCNNCDSKKEDTTPTPTPTPDPEPTPEPTPTKVRYYKYVKYGSWESGYSNASNAENKKETITTYNYCKSNDDYKNYYTTGYMLSNCKNCTYQLKLTDVPRNATNVKISNTSYYQSINDYQSYLNKNGSIRLVCTNGSSVYINDAYTFQNASLKSNNFRFSVSNIYYSSSANSWVTDVSINVLNTYGVTPYPISGTNCALYFTPIKFNVNYTTGNTCVRDYASNSSKYSGYTRSDAKTEYIWYHRTIEYKWSKETSLSGYTYTRDYEDRTE